ncbi:MAG: O-antigen ligase family protein [Myxococcota bacterium]
MTLRRLQTFTLAGFAIAVSLGEGIALGLLALLGLMLVLRRDQIRAPGWRAWVPALGVAGWLGCGAVAWALGGYGVLDAGEIGRWLSFSALAIVPLTMNGIDDETLDRIAFVYVAALAIATVFALATVAINVRPGEWLVRGASAGLHQGRMPYDASRTVAGGFYFHRLMYAHVVVIGISVLLARQVTVSLPPLRRIFELTVLVAFFLGLFLTYARAALFAAAAAGAILAITARGRSRYALIGVGVVGIGIALAIPSVRSRVASGLAAQASTERSLIWAQAVRVSADHPLGIGLGNYSRVVSEYYDTAQASFPTRTYGHNIWLTTWAESGPLGVACFVGGFALLGWFGFLRRGDPFGASALALVTCIFMIGLTHDMFFHPPVAMSWAGVLGYLAARLERAEP